MSKLTDELKKHGPTAGVAVVAAIVAANLSVPDSPEMPKLPELPAELAHAEQHPRRGGISETRLVSCGASTDAAVTGDDLVGLVTLGAGAGQACTLLFSQRWEKPPMCLVEGGIVADTTTTDLIVNSITGAAFAYRCTENQ